MEMISIWLWGGIFVSLKAYFSLKKEIKEAKLEPIHLCLLFTIFCFVGFPIMVIRVFKLWKYDDEDENYNKKSDEKVEEEYRKEIVELLKEVKDKTDLFLRYFR